MALDPWHQHFFNGVKITSSLMVKAIKIIVVLGARNQLPESCLTILRKDESFDIANLFGNHLLRNNAGYRKTEHSRREKFLSENIHRSLGKE